MKKYLAEVLGTFLLVFLGTASVVLGGLGSDLPVGQGFIGLAFGIGVICAAYAVGPISGAHLNPAVTVGVFLAGRMPASEVAGYILAQIVGAIIATLALVIICSGAVTPVTNFGANGWDRGSWSVMGAFLAELIATFVFVMVILGVTAEKHATAFAGLAIGLTLAAIHFALIPITGTSVNPARSIGPALFSTGAMGQLWLFIIAPLIGGALAGIVAKTRAFELE
ncbi:MAG: aquaporin [Rhizobiaceae bacterium]|nr:aquaporin [Rhizobiaceae bacterium]